MLSRFCAILGIPARLRTLVGETDNSTRSDEKLWDCMRFHKRTRDLEVPRYHLRFSYNRFGSLRRSSAPGFVNTGVDARVQRKTRFGPRASTATLHPMFATANTMASSLTVEQDPTPSLDDQDKSVRVSIKGLGDMRNSEL